MTSYVIEPAQQVVLPVRGSDAKFPVRRIYCIGRNYADHAIEMGHDPDKEPPFFFQKMPIISTPAEIFPIHHKLKMCILKWKWWSH